MICFHLFSNFSTSNFCPRFGQDMNFRDYAQGAFRMRKVGKGGYNGAGGLYQVGCIPIY